MQNESGFGITGGINGGSCVGGDTVSLLPWLKAQADNEGMDLESWLSIYADGVTSGYGSREADVEAKSIELATTTRLLPYEEAQIRQAMKEFNLMTQNIAIGEFIQDMRKEQEATAQAAPTSEPAPAPKAAPQPKARKTSKRKSAPKTKKGSKSKSKNGSKARTLSRRKTK